MIRRHAASYYAADLPFSSRRCLRYAAYARSRRALRVQARAHESSVIGDDVMKAARARYACLMPQRLPLAIFMPLLRAFRAISPLLRLVERRRYYTRQCAALFDAAASARCCLMLMLPLLYYAYA